ncbi:MAG: zinc transporter ZupT [Sulfurovum sp.]|nr:zinc transporter ZupT [Sulfurovum sp.]MBT8349585.1 zinc transporter ZupT [Sulfurovum sp.]NNJ46165.1 zinc transporter ZupT [Sulfurovum sp.]
MQAFTMAEMLPAFLLTLFAGLSTAFGALIAFWGGAKNTKFLSVGLGFSAGVMIYVSFVEILVKSQDVFTLKYGEILGESLGLLAFFIGIAISFIIDQSIPDNINPHHSLDVENTIDHDDTESIQKHRAPLSRIGLFTAIAIALHNFPEGFATFISALDNMTAGIAIAMAIAIHNIPEGLAVALPVYHESGNRKKAFLYALGSGLAEPIGAVIGFLILAPIMGDLTLGITFGVVAGIMVYISFDELLPAARVYGNDHTTIFGLVIGMLVMSVSLILFKL